MFGIHHVYPSAFIGKVAVAFNQSLQTSANLVEHVSSNTNRLFSFDLLPELGLTVLVYRRQRYQESASLHPRETPIL